MKITSLGKDLSGRLLFPPLDQDIFIERLTRNLVNVARDIPRLRGALGGEIRRPIVDQGDPRAAGWTFVVSANDPRRHEYVEVLAPLARWRGTDVRAKPLVFDADSTGDWIPWIEDEIFGRSTDGKRVPKYILLAGGPKEIPFHFQSLLGTFAYVGRVDFEDLGGLSAYVEKILRLEQKESDPIVDREVVLFGTNHGPQDPTYYSSRYMVDPLAAHCELRRGFRTVPLMSHDATKANLLSTLSGRRPAVFYSASHGLGLDGPAPMSLRRDYNGAICCHGTGQGLDTVFSAADVPSGPFLEGGIFFQFACYGYGTPATSDYEHWFEAPVAEPSPKEPFVSALPKRLLAHPHGPIAYIGHVDTAFLHAFADPDDPAGCESWSTRMHPFVSAVDHLLDTQPSGYAMDAMTSRYNALNSALLDVYDKVRSNAYRLTAEDSPKFVNQWIYRSDAQNYLVFGDPGARLRMPA